jgi:hypothetical protein|tara:strand:+ start:114 stop:404 length:291 start_codon:yes stop_codon:yes gene_type:complete
MLKATMIILIAGLADPQTAEYDSLDACFKAAPAIVAQESVESAACVPAQKPRSIDLSNFNTMINAFRTMIDAIREHEETWGDPYSPKSGHWEPYSE